MADSYWGASPELLTVSVSPSPTATGFTVSSAANLVAATVDHPGQFILVKVAGVHQRAQIQSIIGNAITLVSPLSGAPDTPGEVVNSRELIGKASLNNSAVFNASSVADLKTVNTTQARSGLKYQIAGIGLYQLNKGSAATADDYTVIAPTTGDGRWILQVGNVWQTVTGATTLTHGGCYIANSATRVSFTLPNSVSVGFRASILNRGTGGFSVSAGSGQTIRDWTAEHVYGEFGSSTYPYTAIELIGTAANQVTITTPSAGLSWGAVGAGYLAGGITASGDTNVIDKLTYSTESRNTLVATLGANSNYQSGSVGISGLSKGYFVGPSSAGTAIDDMDYATQTSSTLAATLSPGRYAVGAAASSSNGYVLGGYNSASVANISRLNLSNDAVSAVTDTLDTIRSYAGTVQSSSTAWVLGGFSTGGTSSNTIERFVFANETSGAVGNTLPAALTSTTACSGPTAGYLMGGSNSGGTRQSTIVEFTHATESAAAIAATLDTAKFGGAGCYSAVKGYHAGGDTGSKTAVMEDLNFTTKASVVIAATLSSARSYAQGVSSLAV